MVWDSVLNLEALSGGGGEARRRQGVVTGSPSTIIGLNAVIVTVTDEVPRVLIVRRATHALATPAQKGTPVNWTDSPDALPFGPFDPARHRTLELGLRSWVKEQTGLPLGYVEQLYSFGDRYRDLRELAGGPRLVSIGYIALMRQAPPAGTGEAEWCNWYDFLPWEDWRDGRPAIIDRVIQPRLRDWLDEAPEAKARRARRDRVSIAFGLDDVAWDFERVLERYETLYEAGMVAELVRDRAARAAYRGEDPPPEDRQRLAAAKMLGSPMALDNRRVLATALGRVRGKLKYRPTVFELLPRSFTLLELQRVVEALSGVRLHKQNFRRLVITGGLVEPTGRRRSQTGGRPAELFRFRREVLRERLAPGVGIPALRITT